MLNLGFVYARFTSEYGRMSFKTFDKLLEAVAIASDNNNLIYFDGNNERHIYFDCTKQYIANKATELVQNLDRIPVGKHMSLLVSKKQINRLIKICSGKTKKYRLSCYSLIILHTIYDIIKNSNAVTNYAFELDMLSREIQVLADNYYRYSGDELAEYIVNCYPTVHNEFTNLLGNDVVQFPCIHRKF